MKIHPLQFAVVLCLFPLLLAASDFSRKERNKAELNLKAVGIALFAYAGENDEVFPRTVEKLIEYTKENSSLNEFLKEKNFSYYGSKLKVYELTKDTIVCTHTFPDQGKLTLLGYGDVRWEEQK